MSKKIRIKIGSKKVTAELNSSRTAGLFYQNLPMQLSLNRWGDEYYGNCGLDVKREDGARAEVEVGELAIWPDGSALCIFFGPTPASTDENPKAISPVNPIGRIEDDVSFLKLLSHTVDMEIEAL
jgi:hypothetical protein